MEYLPANYNCSSHLACSLEISVRNKWTNGKDPSHPRYVLASAVMCNPLGPSQTLSRTQPIKQSLSRLLGLDLAPVNEIMAFSSKTDQSGHMFMQGVAGEHCQSCDGRKV